MTYRLSAQDGGMVDVAGLESNSGVCCDPSLVLPHRCSSGEGTQHSIYYRFSALGGRLVDLA